MNYRLGSLERNTSIYMEKISKNIFLGQGQQKHLHVRGENERENPDDSIDYETPPHTWRKFRLCRGFLLLGRNTSTYVEKISQRC